MCIQLAILACCNPLKHHAHCMCYWYYNINPSKKFTQFIVVQPVTHKGNSLKNWFTKYTTHGANQTKLRTSTVPWSQIHGTGQSKPRTSIVIYVNFLNYQRNAYSSSRHTTQAYNRHTQATDNHSTHAYTYCTQHTTIQSHNTAQHTATY